ncbi:MAG: hypothetical protein ABI321_10080 [Polyangia bacterium]
MALLRWCSILLLAGCFSPGLDGKFSCASDGTCPPGLSCIAGLCGDDAGPTADASTVADAARPTDSGQLPVADAAIAKTDASSSCQPASCAQGACGNESDGCGGTLICGDCPSGQVCGGVSPNVCNADPPCVPTTCQALKAHCGSVSDGCGKVLDCGVCPNGKSCGEKKPNMCG